MSICHTRSLTAIWMPSGKRPFMHWRLHCRHAASDASNTQWTSGATTLLGARLVADGVQHVMWSFHSRLSLTCMWVCQWRLRV